MLLLGRCVRSFYRMGALSIYAPPLGGDGLVNSRVMPSLLGYIHNPDQILHFDGLKMFFATSPLAQATMRHWRLVASSGRRILIARPPNLVIGYMAIRLGTYIPTREFGMRYAFSPRPLILDIWGVLKMRLTLPR